MLLWMEECTSASDKELRRRRKVRNKREQTKITDMNMPNAANVTEWKSKLFDRVASCALNKTERQVTKFLDKAEPDSGIKYEKLMKAPPDGIRPMHRQS